ncbi:hypothetical protein [Stutzerimonas chloritidismutans]|uniref:hypothetical protein n=1 Tax=Stutzerimonas chloritidismutans TaxID=203192 RepID=UPI003F170CC2
MQYLGLAVVIALFALVTVLVALRLLLGGNWLLGWLRGTFGLLVLGLGALIGLIAWDARTYQPLEPDKPLATLTFQGEGEQRYQVRIEQGEHVRHVTLEGDLWQLDVRLLEWRGLATLIGLEPGYRLERLSGRYLAVEQQDLARSPRVLLGQSLFGIDAWSWLQKCQCSSIVLEARPLRVSYLPIASGAEYAIELTPAGLLARPANDVAEKALKEW